MSLGKPESGSEETLALIKKYTHMSKGVGLDVKVSVSHSGFSLLPSDTQAFVQAVLEKLYFNDFKVLQADFDYKLGAFLSLISNALEHPDCTDITLRQTLESTREKVLRSIGNLELNADLAWLKKIGFSRDGILKLYVKLPKGDEIAALREKADTYLSFLGKKKRLAEILLTHQGIEKLRRLPSFHKYCTSIGFVFNGAQLVQLVAGAGWKEKMDHFQTPGKLEMLQGFEFNSSHVAQMVRGSGWKAKLAYAENSQNMDKLKNLGFNTYHISQVMGGCAWRTKLNYFKNPVHLQPFFDAGFEPGHLAKIVDGADWRLKLRLILKPSCSAALASKKLTHFKLATLLSQGGWRARLAVFGIKC